MARRPQTLAVRLRAANVVLHRWLGLVAGVLFVLLGLSGSLLVFGPELLAVQHPALAGPPPAAWEASRTTVLSRTLEAHPPGHVTLVRFPGHPLGVYEVYLADDRQEYRHALSGEVLHERTALGDVLMVARDFHTHLLAGEIGELTLGWLGLVLLVLLASGLWMWWPRQGMWRASLSYPMVRFPGPLLYWWHSTSGALAFLLLGFLSLTGAAIVFYAISQSLLTGLFGGQPPDFPSRVAAHAETRWPLVLQRLDATLPEGRTVFFYPPAEAGEPLVFRKQLPGELHPNGRSHVLLDGWGELAAAYDASAAEWGIRATDSIYPLHAGRAGARWWQWTVAIAGLVPLALFATGFVMWRRTRMQARRRVPLRARN